MAAFDRGEGGGGGMLFQNMILDELIAEGKDSANQLLYEICKRLSGPLKAPEG